MKFNSPQEQIVLLTNGGARTSYAALRSLASIGLRCIASDASRLGMCQFSRLPAAKYQYTSHYQNEDEFISQLQQLVKEEKVSLIFPSHNETEVIAKNRDRFEQHITSIVPAYEHCVLFNNKKLSYDLAESLGIPTPRRVKYHNLDELDAGLKSSQIEKSVVKLLTGNSAKGVFYADTPAEAKDIVERLIREFDLGQDRLPQVEEHVIGDGYGSSVLFWKGQPVADFTHRRLRDKIDTGGTSTLREAASHEGIEAAAQKIFSSVGWHGLAMCEFKVCTSTGRFWFIEVNPRLWGSISLAINAGVDFPLLAYICSIEGRAAAINYKSKIRSANTWRARWLLGDVFVSIKNIRKNPAKIFSKASAKVDSLDDFFWDDPLVFLGELLAYLKNTLTRRSLNPTERGMIG